MSIQQPPYRPRSDKYLDKRLRETLNLLQMRDWNVTLEIGDGVPVRFQDSDNGTSVCRCWYYAPLFQAEIWISPHRCKVENTDPLFNMLHEVAHCFLDGGPHEEAKCNVIATLLM